VFPSRVVGIFRNINRRAWRSFDVITYHDDLILKAYFLFFLVIENFIYIPGNWVKQALNMTVHHKIEKKNGIWIYI
jgi:hypothetical protein